MVPWLGADDPFPPVERALGAASGAPGLLAASARPAAVAPDRRLPARHFPVVFGRPAGAVVESRSAHDPAPRRVQTVAVAAQNAQARAARRRMGNSRRPRFRRRDARLRASAATRPARHVDHRRRGRSVFVAASGGRCAQHRNLVRRQARGRFVWRVVRQDVLRRIDVRGRHRCVENGAGRACRTLAPSQNRNDRLPAEHVASGVAGRSRDSAQGVRRACSRVCRRSRRFPGASTRPRCSRSSRAAA